MGLQNLCSRAFIIFPHFSSLSYNLKLIFDEQSMSSSLCSSLLPSSAFVIDEDPSIPTICVALMSAALSGLTATGVADCGLTGRHLGKRITVFAPLLRLLNTATDLFLFCLRPSVRSTEGKVKGTFAQSARPGGDAEGTLTFDLLSATKPTNCDRLPTQNIVSSLHYCTITTELLNFNFRSILFT